MFQVPFAETVTNPVNNFVPVADEMVKVPLVPPPMVVVPLTVRANPATVKVVPFPIIRLPTVKPTVVVAVALPLKVKLPVIDVIVVSNVFAPEPEKVTFPG